tara:strand:- start:21010 stop:22269 length:1260 start_codon:yes stop_codon:yes gene_type:complete
MKNETCKQCGEPMVRFDGAKDAESDGNPDDFWFNGWICESCGERKPLASYMNGRAKLKAQYEEPVSIETDSETVNGIDDPQAIRDMLGRIGSQYRDIGDDGVAETPSKDAESVGEAINSLMIQFATEWNPFGQSRFGSEYHLEAEGLDPEDAHPVLHHGVMAGILLKEDHVYYLASPPPPFPPMDGEGEGDADGEAEEGLDDESGEAEDGEGAGEGESEDSEGEGESDGDSESGSEGEGEGGSESDGDGSEGEGGEGGDSEGEGDGGEGEGGESGEGSEGSGEGGEGTGEGTGEGDSKSGESGAGNGAGGKGDMMDEASSKSFKEWLEEQSQAIKDSFGEGGDSGPSGSPKGDFNAFGGEGYVPQGEHSLDAQGRGDADMTDGHDSHHRRKGSASDFMKKAMRGKKFKDTFGDYEEEME